MDIEGVGRRHLVMLATLIEKRCKYNEAVWFVRAPGSVDIKRVTLKDDQVSIVH